MTRRRKATASHGHRAPVAKLPTKLPRVAAGRLRNHLAPSAALPARPAILFP